MPRHRWTEQEIEFVRKIYPYNSNKKIIEMLKEKFGFETTSRKLLNTKTKYKMPDKVIPNSGRLQKGVVPWNKGKKMSNETKKKLKNTFFRKGQTINNRPIGSTRLGNDGYLVIKIEEPNKWQLYQRYVYEKAHGVKLAKNEAVIFADGDKTNFDIDNLIKVSKANLCYLNSNNLIFDDPELTKVGVTVSKVAEKINERKSVKK